MRTGMRMLKTFRNLMAMAAIVVAAVVVMPKSVWAGDVTGVSVSLSKNELKQGETSTITITANGDASTCKVSISTSLAGASVDATSKEITLSAGSGTETVTYTAGSTGGVDTISVSITEVDGATYGGSPISDSKTLTVLAKATTVNFDSASATVAEGADFTITGSAGSYTYIDDSSVGAEFATSDSSKVSLVSMTWNCASGGATTFSLKVHGVAAGSSDVSSRTTPASKCVVTVTATKTLDHLDIIGAPASIKVNAHNDGLSIKCQATYTDSTTEFVGVDSWSFTTLTGSPGKAIPGSITGTLSFIDTSGFAASGGSVRLKASYGGKEAFADIVVSNSETTVTASIPSYVIVGKDTATITPTVTSSAASLTAADVTWSCAPSGAVTFSSPTGAMKITGVTAGTVDIIAKVVKSGTTYFNGKVGTITVIPAWVAGDASITATPDSLGTSGKSTLTAVGTPGSFNKVKWTVTAGGGTVSPAEGTTTTYTAPASIASDSTATIKAEYYYGSDLVSTTTVTKNIALKALKTVTVSDVIVSVGGKVKVKFTTDPADAVYTVTGFTGIDDVKPTGSTTSDLYFEGTKENTTGRTFTVAVGGKIATGTVKVYRKPSIEYSDKKLKIAKMPEKIYSGSNDIDSVSGGVIAILYDGEELYKTSASSSYGSTSDEKTVDVGKIQELIEKSEVYDKLKKLDKDKTTLQFRIYGSGNDKTNKDIYGQTDVEVYRITVSGTGIETEKKYGVKGAEVKISAKAASGYNTPTWKDGTSNNPRTVSIDGAKTYEASAVLGAKNNNLTTNTPGAAGGANGTGNSKLDKVPKTGEGREVFFMWTILIVCSLAAGAVLIAQAKSRKASASKNQNK